MSRRVGLSAAAPLLALVALVSTAGIPGPVPAPPVPAAAPVASPSPEPEKPGAAEVKQILTDLEAVDTDEGLVVALPEQVLFDFNQADLRSDAQATLAKVAQVIGFYTEARVEIQGHTDDVGEEAYNQGLSERRAAAVREHLSTVAGVAAERLVALGYGESRPAVPNDSDESRQRNRRVEVVIVGT